MASLTTTPAGDKVVYVTLPSSRPKTNGKRHRGKRKPIRLGKIGDQKAERWRGSITELEQARLNGVTAEAEARRWAEGAKGKLREQLAACGLVAPLQQHELDAFISEYIKQRVDLKSSTTVIMDQTHHRLRDFFPGRTLESITPADADAWKAKLVGDGLAKATIAKRCRYARHFFEVAKRRDLVESNPFEHISSAVKGDPNRRRYVPAKDVEAVVKQLPDAEWRLLVALARYAGVRVPSEPWTLTWADVDFEGKRFIIRATKTEHHEHGGIRVVPMFADGMLEQRFQEVFDQAEEGELHVFAGLRRRCSAMNLRTSFQKYIERAGVKPWPKLWVNLRASAATDLADQYPGHLSAAWLGHTERIADGFYRMATDEHFAKAVRLVRKTVRAGGSGECTEEHNPRLEGAGGHVGATMTTEMGDEGLEPPTSRV